MLKYLKQKLLSRDEVMDLEPKLNPIFDAGFFYENAMHARDPYGILKKIFEHQARLELTCRFTWFDGQS